jgi:hypothetical protein
MNTHTHAARTLSWLVPTIAACLFSIAAGPAHAAGTRFTGSSDTDWFNPLNCTDRFGGYGGGLIRVVAGGTVALDGTLSANGQNGPGWGSSGGSGGGIYVTCRRLEGAGTLAANGGNGYNTSGSGGGGGRIAVWYSYGDHAPLNASVTAGAVGPAGDVGTIVWGHIPGGGTVIFLR